MTAVTGDLQVESVTGSLHSTDLETERAKFKLVIAVGTVDFFNVVFFYQTVFHQTSSAACFFFCGLEHTDHTPREVTIGLEVTSDAQEIRSMTVMATTMSFTGILKATTVL